MARSFSKGETNTVVALPVLKGSDSLIVTLVDASPLYGRERFIPFFTGEYKYDFIFKGAVEDRDFKVLARWIKTNLNQEHNQIDIRLCPKLQSVCTGTEYSLSEVRDVVALFVDKNATEVYITLLDQHGVSGWKKVMTPIYSGTHKKTHQLRMAMRKGDLGYMAMYVKDEIRDDLGKVTVSVTPAINRMSRR